MTHDKDKILLRAKDLSLLILVLTVMGMFFGPAKKIFKMEETITVVEQLRADNIEMKTKMAVINSQYSDITRQLEQINWQLRRMNGGERIR